MRSNNRSKTPLLSFTRPFISQAALPTTRAICVSSLLDRSVYTWRSSSFFCSGSFSLEERKLTEITRTSGMKPGFQVNIGRESGRAMTPQAESGKIAKMESFKLAAVTVEFA
jgi:hypothetical protein